jgi:hypothetical protein
MDLKVDGTKRKIQIAELDEWREKAYHSAKQFKPGDKVLLFNSRFHLFGHGKLHSKWEGP